MIVDERKPEAPRDEVEILYDWREEDISTWPDAEQYDEITKPLYDDDKLTHLLLHKSVAHELAEVFILDKELTPALTGKSFHFKIKPDDPNMFCYVTLQRTGAWKFDYQDGAPLRLRNGEYRDRASCLLRRLDTMLKCFEDNRGKYCRDDVDLSRISLRTSEGCSSEIANNAVVHGVNA